MESGGSSVGEHAAIISNKSTKRMFFFILAGFNITGSGAQDEDGTLQKNQFEIRTDFLFY